MKNRLRLMMVLGMSLGVAACDTDYGSIDKDPYPFNVPVSGIWTGTYSYQPAATGTTTPAAETIDVLMVATETNEFWIVESDETTGCLHVGNGEAYSKQSAISGSYGWGSDCPFTDGTTQGYGTISGTATLHDKLALSFTETTAAGSSYATFAPDFAFQGIYLEGSALSTVAGNYTDGGGTAVSIDGSGKISGAGIGTCAADATVSLIDSKYNLYRVTYVLSGCTASGDTALNGITMTGLGFYNDSTSLPSPEFVYTIHGTDGNGTPVITTDRFARN